MLKSSHRKGKICIKVFSQAYHIMFTFTRCAQLIHHSILHSADIEDKGTSGETFLAAVEYLEQEQPKMAIFENVENAPWEKMQEYIKGRIELKNRNDTKNITGMKEGGE